VGNVGLSRSRVDNLNMATRILLADENQFARQGLRALLEREPNLEVTAEASNGQTALRLVKEMAPDLVIVDLAMPDLSGFEVIPKILADCPGVKVLALSIYADRRFVVNVLRAGATGYLLKDCAFEELVGAINAVVANRTYISPGLSELVVKDYLEVLREGEERFRTIFEGASLGISLVDRDGRIVESNPALQKMLGYNQEELQQKVFTDFIGAEDAERCKILFTELVAEKRESYQVEKPYTRKDGRSAWGRLSVSPFRGLTEENQFAVAMVEDITEKKQAEGEVRVYQDKLRAVASELSLTEERERRRLATDLHDHVGQILALAQIKLGALRESASSTNLAGAMDEVRRLIEQTIRFTRSLTFELSPPILYDLGFEAAIEWLAELIQDQHGIPIEVQADRNPKPMDDESRILLFHGIRELLLNVVKQAKTNRVGITIKREGTNLRVRVEGDGVSLEITGDTPLGSYGMGLFSIRERLRCLGGDLEVDAEPGPGAGITLVLPLKY
jgi:PAS domain S-box-containing protein